ncbi:MAG: TIGR00341 family protein [Pseudomonadota bacterium]|nr:TIGR00341 family protein [Pseudomonadota bacterium]
MKFTIDLTEERKVKVYEDLARGSDPRGSFFLLVAVSTIIASLGLVMNSTAVVIGAMLVAPLMTPILGLALALVRGDAPLIGVAMRSETFGVGVSILVAALLGLALPSHFDATPEMLSRTSPNLLDLLVAVFAGLAGAYALVDEKLSPVLPGVAISTAIVPPLANSGLSLALGAYAGAWGSFLLFFTNFLSILLVASLVFSLAGMGERLHLRAGVTIARRFGVAAVGFVVVAVLLSGELLKMFDANRLEKQLSLALQDELADQRISDIDNLLIERQENGILVLAHVNGPAIIEPSTVKKIQTNLEDVVLEPVELFVRTNVTHDVSASGSIHQAVAESLDGFFVPAKSLDPRIAVLQTAEQILREHLEQKIGMHLENLEVYPTGEVLTLVAEISGARELGEQEILIIENQIGSAIPELPLQLIVRHETSRLRDKFGNVRVEFSQPVYSAETIEIEARVRDFLTSWTGTKGFRVHASSMTRLDDAYHFLIELKGPSLFSDNDYAQLKGDLKEVFDFPLEIYVRSELETVLGPEGKVSLPDLLDDYRRRNRDAYREETRRLIEEAR